MNKKHDPVSLQISLKVALVNKKGEHLILKARSNNPHFSNKYDLPGGRINKDEINTNFHLLIDREIKEEAGEKIKYKLRPDPVSLSKYRYANENGVLYILFEAKYLSGKIKISEEHSGYLWQKLSAAKIKKIFPRSLRQLLLNDLKWND